jgi:hypothetical protein
MRHPPAFRPYIHFISAFSRRRKRGLQSHEGTRHGTDRIWDGNLPPGLRRFALWEGFDKKIGSFYIPRNGDCRR